MQSSQCYVGPPLPQKAVMQFEVERRTSALGAVKHGGQSCAKEIQQIGIEIVSGSCPISDFATSACGSVRDTLTHLLPSFSTTMFLRRSLIVILLATVAAFFCAQSVEAAKGPKITNKIYFDIKHGDKELGRSTCLVLVPLGSRLAKCVA